ncbi:hypothetical protein PG993_015088 [Apiospora rasikravindrae]|uniref:Uncharacterized protein n=1 Tax=Apiospora rasikravindrae TaxID=990691 RepID=A0ABR1RPL3_9PEZI
MATTEMMPIQETPAFHMTARMNSSRALLSFTRGNGSSGTGLSRNSHRGPPAAGHVHLEQPVLGHRPAHPRVVQLQELRLRRLEAVP